MDGTLLDPDDGVITLPDPASSAIAITVRIADDYVGFNRLLSTAYDVQRMHSMAMNKMIRIDIGRELIVGAKVNP